MGQQVLNCNGFLLLSGAAVCNANTVTVTVNVSDDAGSGNCLTTCALRDAIASAAAGDTIDFAPGLSSPITLTQGQLLVGKALTINGPGAARDRRPSGPTEFLVAAQSAPYPHAIDQHDISRPQGSACDLGAIEADYIFVEGFGK